jgi:hypothetical protein
MNLETVGCHASYCSAQEKQKLSRKGNSVHKGGSGAQGQFGSFEALLRWLIRIKLLKTVNDRARLWNFTQFGSTGRVVKGNKHSAER